MQNKSPFFSSLAMTVWMVLAVFLGIFMFPWKMISWGSLKLGSERTITVTGTAETKTKNQIASFTAGITVTKDKKDEAVSEVNTKMEEVVKAMKGFGIKTEDIKTQNNSIYQVQEMYYDNGVQKSRPGQWSVSNNVEIVLREVDRSSALSDLLAKTGANNVYGPNFMMDETTSIEEGLAGEAILNARTKAEAMAKSGGAKVGEIISVVEGGETSPVFPMLKGMGGGGGAVTEPGSATVSKSVTVTFRLE